MPRWPEGNPLHAIELVHAHETAVSETGSDAATSALSIRTAITDLIAERYLRLPPGTRRAVLLLAASAESLALCDLDMEALGPAIDAGLVRVRSRRGELVHPLYQTAILELAGPSERESAHAELAGRAAAIEDRARHLALSTTVPDAAIAEILERGATGPSASRQAA